MSYCNWEHTSRANQKYHDREWGIPVHTDRKQFEFLMMEVMQCGLSWDLMINKRAIFRACFDHFDFNRIARYNQKDINRILHTPGMIKSRRKIEAIINNARCFLALRKEFGTFCKYLWGYAGGKTILYEKHALGYIPASNGLSEKISLDLKKRGFKYLGPITIYSHLQAAGLINDHDPRCPRHRFILERFPIVRKPRNHEKGVHCFRNKQSIFLLHKKYLEKI